MVENVDLNTHHEMVMEKLHEIDGDTDCILKKLEGDEKMTDNFDAGALMGMLANKGVDPGVIAIKDAISFSGTTGATAFTGTGSLS